MGVVPDDIILAHILPHLHLTSRVRLAAVSKSCQTLSRLLPLPTGLPWLIGDAICLKSAINILNLDIGGPNPSIHFPRPPTVSVINSSFQILGSVEGNAILALSAGGIVLYNPFSGETSRAVPMNSTDYSSINRVQILTEQGLVVACTDWSSMTLFACRFGQSDWVRLNFDRTVCDFIFHKDMLYCISSQGNIHSFDLQDLLTNPHMATPSTLYQHNHYLEPDFGPFYYHLVDSCGDLLVVIEPRDKHSESEFLVYRVELNEQCTSASLKPMNDLADRMLFVGQICSVSCPLPTDPLRFFSKNSSTQ